MSFFMGDLKEEVYVDPPPRFVAEGRENNVCHLKKSFQDKSSLPEPGLTDSVKL